MPDRAKVMDALEHCSDRTQKRCNPTCPYHNRNFCETELASDALVLMKEQQEKIDRMLEESASNAEMAEGFAEMLKEQEAVEPEKEDDGTPEPWTMWWYVCGDCGRPIDKMDRYCRGCGKQVKWE